MNEHAPSLEVVQAASATRSTPRNEEGAANGAAEVRVEVVGQRFSPRRHWGMLGLCSAVVLLSCILFVTPGDEVAPRLVPGRALPGSCVSRTWFGVECPGCGLTRSFVQLASFRPAASFAAHPLGWLLAIYVVAQFPYRLLAMRRRVHHPLGRTWALVLSNGLVVLLVIVWLARMVPSFTNWRTPADTARTGVAHVSGSSECESSGYEDRDTPELPGRPAKSAQCPPDGHSSQTSPKHAVRTFR